MLEQDQYTMVIQFKKLAENITVDIVALASWPASAPSIPLVKAFAMDTQEEIWERTFCLFHWNLDHNLKDDG